MAVNVGPAHRLQPVATVPGAANLFNRFARRRGRRLQAQEEEEKKRKRREKKIAAKKKKKSQLQGRGGEVGVWEGQRLSRRTQGERDGLVVGGGGGVDGSDRGK